MKSVPTTPASTDMASVLAEIDAAMARSAAVEDAETAARTAAMSADRETTHAVVEPAAGADTPETPAVPPKEKPAEVPRPVIVNLALDSGAEFRSRLHWFIGVSDVTSRDPGSLTYEPYFGLREKPFSLSSDPRFFFSHSSHGAAFDTLAAGIRRREGLLVLAGEVGTGKTTLCRAVLQSMDQKTFAAFVPDPFLSREELLKTLLVDFGVVSVDEIRSGRLRGATRSELSYPLYEFLTSLQPLKAFAVVMIDEAQNLTPELLEEIRILSDLEHGQKLLEVVLVGQPELQSRLATPAMRQLSQRVSVRCELSPLVRGDIARYIAHRLTIAGNDGRVQFTDAAIEFVWAASNGTPRVINLICDRALLCAARSRTMSVKAEHVVWAVDDLKLPVAGTFDQARALESFPEEFPEAAALEPEEFPEAATPEHFSVATPEPEEFAEATPEREEQPHVPPTDAFAPAAAEEPGDPFKSFLMEFHRTSAERQDQPRPPQTEDFWAADPAAISPAAVVRPAEPSATSHVLAANFSRALPGSRVDDARDSAFPIAAARTLQFDADLAAARQRRTRWLTLAAACLALTTVLIGYWYSTTAAPARADALTPSAQIQKPVNPSPAPEGRPATSSEPASGGALAVVAPPAGDGVRAGAPDGAAAQAAGGFALQMATFQSAARAAQAVQEFRDAGYAAYTAERSLRDGTSAHPVFLGPYTERAAAERDRERARQIPGYDGGLIVPIGPTAAAPKPQ